MEEVNQGKIMHEEVVRAMINRGMSIDIISKFAEINMQDLLEFCKNNYPEKYKEELAKLSDEKKGRSK